MSELETIKIMMSENSCYLKIIRPPYKTACHFFSGSSQIERVSTVNDHPSLEYSIRHSKVLQEYKDRYPYSQQFKEEQIKYLFAAKQIVENKDQFYVGRLVREVHCYEHTVHMIQELRKKKYDPSNMEHQNKLLTIWKNLMPEEQLTGRVSEQWIKVGFQAADPATDFRGAGFLGLENLLRFSEMAKGKQAFRIASAQETAYFFCAAGLFFTMLAKQLLRSNAIGYQFWVHASEAELINNFQQLYNMLFLQFSCYWLKECSNKSIMYFNQNLKDYEQLIKNTHPYQLKIKLQTHNEQ